MNIPSLNQSNWPALRELIGAEAALAVARLQCDPEKIAKLEAQVTRMETAFRESLPKHPAAARAEYLDRVMPTSEQMEKAMFENMACYDCGAKIKPGDGHECEQMKKRLDSTLVKGHE